MLDYFYGPINGEVNFEVQQTSFHEAFSQAVLLSNYHLLTMNDLTVALYIDLSRNFFYLFDSHERDCHGLHTENGASVLLQFDSLDELFLFLFQHYTGFSYELTPVHILTHQMSNDSSFKDIKGKRKANNDVLTTGKQSKKGRNICPVSVSDNSNDKAEYFKADNITTEKQTMHTMEYSNNKNSANQYLNENSSLINIKKGSGDNKSGVIIHRKRNQKNSNTCIPYGNQTTVNVNQTDQNSCKNCYSVAVEKNFDHSYF